MSVISASSRSSSNDSLNIKEEELAEEVKLAINIALNRFYISNELKEFEFPTSFTSNERLYVHKLCKLNDLTSTTKGKGCKKYVHVMKKDEYQYVVNQARLRLSDKSKELLNMKSSSISLGTKEKEDLIPRIQKPNSSSLYEHYRRLDSIPNISPLIPNLTVNNKDILFPIDLLEKEIVEFISSNRLVMIAGETGLGKTSRIPQFLLQNSQWKSQKCRILVSQPNSELATGAKFRLENNCSISTESCITFVTNKVLMKNFPSLSDPNFQITHLVLDEMQIRDRYSDFILLQLKDLLTKNKNIKVIMISASSGMIDLMQKFFPQCPIMKIPSKMMNNCQELFLEDIIKFTDYLKEDCLRKNLTTNQSGVKLLENWCVDKRKRSFFKDDLNSPIRSETEEEIDADSLLEKTWIDGDLELFNVLIELIEKGKIDVNYQHSQTNVTGLMSASISGHLETIEKLLSLGANCNLKSCNDFMAVDWAKRFTKAEVVELIECYQNTSFQLNLNEFVLEKEFINETNLKQLDDHLILKAFYRHLSNLSCLVDYKLIIALLKKIYANANQGSVLVILPSVNEIETLEKLINEDEYFKKYQLFKLYTKMEAKNFGNYETEKIILTTNLGENMISLGDIISVIDSGINFEILNDSSTNSLTRRNIWISKQCALNRKNKLPNNKPTKCFRLYSKYRYKNFISQAQSEIITRPLQEICLISKLAVPFNTSITDLISRAPESPAFLELRNSINHLKVVDALDTWEDMSELGVHLVNLMPIFGDLRYAKMIVFAIGLRCLDPIIALVSTLIVGEPFDQLFSSKLAEAKKNFLSSFDSDHLVLIKIYQEWKEALWNNTHNAFCQTNFLNPAKMNQIESQRVELLKYLETSGLINRENMSLINHNLKKSSCIKAAIIAGLYPNIIRIDKKNNRLVNEKDTKIKLSSQSIIWPNCLKNTTTNPYEWLTYDDWSQCGNIQFIRRSSLVSTMCMALFCGSMKLSEKTARFESGDDSVEFKIDGWLSLTTSKEDFESMFMLRQKWYWILLKVIKLQALSAEDKDAIEVLVDVLENEENLIN